MEEGVDEMTRFLKRVERANNKCDGCIFRRPDPFGPCRAFNVPFCGTDKIYILVSRPPDGTRCRDLDGNIKVVGRDV